MTNHTLEIIGMHEPVNFSEQGIVDLPTKTDTGAYNSAIDCCYTEEKENEEGGKVLYFTLLNSTNEHYTGQKHSTSDYKVKKVRSSNGIETYRYQVKLSVGIKGRHFHTTFNLSDRSKMRYPVLLGRKLLADRFLVDVSKHRKLKKE
ncbi:MAG: hypothetical protein ACJAR8_000667 [Bacteroidia bacterium]|jgi:hypothetical protein